MPTLLPTACLLFDNTAASREGQRYGQHAAPARAGTDPQPEPADPHALTA